jgi:hypothetical protein
MSTPNSIKPQDIVAWRISDQGWTDMLCRDKTTFGPRSEGFGSDIDSFFKSIDYNDIRRNTLQGWECIYCGLGHFVIIRKEYYPRFQQLTTGFGQRGPLWSTAFDILVRILEEE